MIDFNNIPRLSDEEFARFARLCTKKAEFS
jgi:hypothetical protein